jgi:hypothetical protein
VIKVGNLVDSINFTIQPDPRINSNESEVNNWADQLDITKETLNTILKETKSIRNTKQEIQNLMQRNQHSERLQIMAKKAIDSIDLWQSKITQLKHQTLEDEDAWETMLAGQLRYLMDVMDRSGPPITDGSILRLNDLNQNWELLKVELKLITENDIQSINDWVKEQDAPYIDNLLK